MPEAETGYGRDCRILDQLGTDYRTVVPCAFIYPDDNAADGENVFSLPLPELLFLEFVYAVKRIIDFCCIGVRVPKLK